MSVWRGAGGGAHEVALIYVANDVGDQLAHGLRTAHDGGLRGDAEREHLTSVSVLLANKYSG